jgi:hypothetical protein
MKLTRFFKLKRAIENLDVNYVAKKIALLEESLIHHGQQLDIANTAITQEGIYYIHPDSGMAVRVALYDSDNSLKLNKAPETDMYLTGYTDEKVIQKLNEYHLVSCNTLIKAQKVGFNSSYRIAQRLDGKFYYRFKIDNHGRRSPQDKVYQEIGNQRLLICPNCFWKVNSLLECVHETNRESFNLSPFFDIESFGSWCRYDDHFDPSESLANMYPADWQEISRIRKEQVQYNCEGCSIDLSKSFLRKYLHVNPVDHVRKKIVYVKLQCLCISCLAEYSDFEHYKTHPEYRSFMELLKKGIIEDSVDAGHQHL